MKIAILADIHGNHTALRAVINDLTEKRIEQVILLGDIVAKGPNPNEAISLLESLNIIAFIKGNTDLWITADISNWKPDNHKEKVVYSRIMYLNEYLTDINKRFINSLPESAVCSLEGHELLLVHGSPLGISDELHPDMDISIFQNRLESVCENIVLTGHSHIGYSCLVNGKLLANPGSIGLCDRGDDNRASYGILDLTDEGSSFQVIKVDYSIDLEVKSAFDKEFGFVDDYRESLTQF